jgi:hypothetical protein
VNKYEKDIKAAISKESSDNECNTARGILAEWARWAIPLLGEENVSPSVVKAYRILKENKS